MDVMSAITVVSITINLVLTIMVIAMKFTFTGFEKKLDRYMQQHVAITNSLTSLSGRIDSLNIEIKDLRVWILHLTGEEKKGSVL